MFGFDKPTAQQLKRLAKSERNKPVRTTRPRYENRIAESLDGAGIFAPLMLAGSIYLVVPENDIPVATKSGSTWTLGKGTAKVFQRTGTEENTQDPNADEPDVTLEAHQDIDTEDDFLVRVFNFSTVSPATEGEIYLAVQDAWGDLYIVQPASATIYRGITSGAINKGASGSVTRNGGGTDTVTNLFANVGTGKAVIYAKIGTTLYLIGAECPLT